MIQEGNISNIFLGGIMGANALFIIYNGPTSLRWIKKLELYYILIAFTFPLPFALYPLLNTLNGARYFGDADQWCWFSKSTSIYGIYLWFILLWIFFAFNLIALFLTAQHFQKMTTLTNRSRSASADKLSKDKKKPTTTLVVRRMVAYMIAFVIVWTPSNINRITQLVVGSPIFGLSVAQSLVSPLRGFLNFCAFIYAWYHSDENKLFKTSSTVLGSGDTFPGRSIVAISNLSVNRSGENFRSGEQVDQL